MEFFTIPNLKISEFLAGIHDTLQTADTVRCPYEPMILSIEHYQGPT